MANEVTATHAVAQYVWSVMQSKLGYDKANYNGMVPIAIPGQQQELFSMAKPYVLYGWSGQSTGGIWLINSEVAAFTIYSHDVTDVHNFINVMRYEFKRLDESAKSVNNYISALGGAYAELKKFDIKTIGIRSLSGPQPPLQEGGRFSGDVIVSIEFTNLEE